MRKNQGDVFIAQIRHPDFEERGLITGCDNPNRF